MGGGFGDNYTALYLSNPQLANALRRQALGYQMMNEGTSGEPIRSPWQGVNKLAQALIGGYFGHEANADIQSAYDKRQALLRDAANGLDNPLMPSQPMAQPDQQPAPQPQATPAGQTPSPQLSYAVHRLESGSSMQPGISGDGGAAAGPMQVHQGAIDDVNRATGNHYTLDQVRADPLLGKRVGDTYLAMLEKRYPGRPDLVLAAYNGGMGNVDRGTIQPAAQQYAQRGMQIAQAGGGMPAQPQTPAQPQAQPATGINSPMIQQAIALQNKARDIRLAAPGDPMAEGLARAYEQRAQMLAGLDSFETVMTPNGPVTVNRRTGETKPWYTSPGRPFTDIHGNTWVANPNGTTSLVANNPTGIGGNSPEADTMRTISEIGPKIKAGTATPQEVAAYNTAAQRYQGFELKTDPSTGALIRAPNTPLPAGMPQPGGGAPGGAVPLTGGSRGPETAQGITKTAGETDIKNVSDEQAKILTTHDLLGTTQTIRSMLPEVTTGVGADARLRLAQIFTALGVDDKTAKAWSGTNAAPGEILQKKLFELTTGAVRGMGAREPGSVMLMFQKNYPQLTSRDLTIDTLTRLLDMGQIYKEDEISNRRDHLNNAISDVSQNKPYVGLSGYKAPDIRPYQAAALAAGGLPDSVWRSGLTPAQQKQAMALVMRAYPDFVPKGYTK